MSTSSREYDHQEESTLLGVGLTGDGGIRIRAASGGVGAAVESTVTGAQRLATMLGSAVTGAIHRGLPGGSTD